MDDKFGRASRYRDDRWGQEEPRRERDSSELGRRDAADSAATSGEPDFDEAGAFPGPDEDATWYSAPPYAPAYVQYGAFGIPPSHPAGVAPLRGGYSGRGPKDYVRADARIREDVCERLSWDDHVDATDVTVRVEHGEVILEGTVESRHMKRLAEDIAESVTGVVDVHNAIRVRKPMLTELKEKLTGEVREEEHYANTGTKTTGPISSLSHHHGH